MAANLVSQPLSFHHTSAAKHVVTTAVTALVSSM